MLYPASTVTAAPAAMLEKRARKSREVRRSGRPRRGAFRFLPTRRSRRLRRRAAGGTASAPFRAAPPPAPAPFEPLWDRTVPAPPPPRGGGGGGGGGGGAPEGAPRGNGPEAGKVTPR